MNLPIQSWINSQLTGKTSDATSGPVKQAMLIRDRIVPLFCHDLIVADLDANFERVRGFGEVVSTHRAWSMIWGVFSLDRPEIGLRIVVRGASDWKLSVISEVPIHAHLGTLACTKKPDDDSDYLDSCYFEGFPSDLIFSYYSKNNRQFSLSLGTEFHLWAAIHMIMVDRGLIKGDR